MIPHQTSTPTTEPRFQPKHDNVGLNNVDCVPSNAKFSRFGAMLYMFEEAVIKMIIKGRRPTMRHESRIHKVTLDWLFDTINLKDKIQIKCVDTKYQVADTQEFLADTHHFWPDNFWPRPLLAVSALCRARRVEAPKGAGTKFRTFCLSLPPQFSFFLPSLGCLFVEFWWCLRRGGRQMCTFGVLGLSCEAPAAPKPPGLPDSPRAQTCTFQGPGLQKHHQNSTRRHQRERKRTKWFRVVWGCLGVFGGVLGVFWGCFWGCFGEEGGRGVLGVCLAVCFWVCVWGVFGVFWSVQGVFRGVQGCFGVFWCVWVLGVFRVFRGVLGVF